MTIWWLTGSVSGQGNPIHWSSPSCHADWLCLAPRLFWGSFVRNAKKESIGSGFGSHWTRTIRPFQHSKKSLSSATNRDSWPLPTIQNIWRCRFGFVFNTILSNKTLKKPDYGWVPWDQRQQPCRKEQRWKSWRKYLTLGCEPGCVQGYRLCNEKQWGECPCIPNCHTCLKGCIWGVGGGSSSAQLGECNLGNRFHSWWQGWSQLKRGNK